ncbi:protein phosphatase 1 regulatory subunit 3B-like [Glandiceps talaboti]
MPVDCSLLFLSSSPPTHNYCMKYPYNFTGLKSRLGDGYFTPRPPLSLRPILNPGSSEKGNGNIVMTDIKDVVQNSTEITKVRKAKTKKRVSFADTKGLSLTSVRIMQEPSDMPPALNIQAIGDLIRDESPQPSSSTTNYIIDFEQPASNYLDFRDKLEKGNVGLENVIIKDSNTIMGTVKVKNISFEKRVKVRYTYDDWASSKDVFATYAPPNIGFGQMNCAAAPERYDTFSFEFQIPLNSNAKKIEFCVCFESDGSIFWDNNHDKNYQIVSEQWKTVSQQEQMQNDYLQLRTSNDNLQWTDFAYWKSNAHDETGLPYW